MRYERKKMNHETGDTCEEKVAVRFMVLFLHLYGSTEEKQKILVMVAGPLPGFLSCFSTCYRCADLPGYDF
jgi:hypothetical protein